ncbi:class I SAM-dependent methyltransferase [Paenibacillus sepulcri]|uniref:Class I SAM-dependent methyltransferase n=1 Tax=Paenibacillus sepulcri TaxID=359917 RepID=A0ABS7C7K6_9BACL|nr:class I SAM-dependent methyltransferase [Paenibacillus sepulcri]
MYPKLVNPRSHKDWLTPHSHAWYAQLARLTGEYAFPWNSTVTEPNGESKFRDEVSLMVQNKKVLDIGCGHGDFTIQWSPVVKQIVGLDITRDFIETGRSRNLANVSFVTANTKHKLPFETEAFDCAYNRKGPTSVYADLKRILKKGGHILGLHPGDRMSPELPRLFPNLFEPLPDGTPVWDKIKNKLEEGGITQAEIETVTAVQYLQEPMDIIKMCCFGQLPSLQEMVINESMSGVERIFSGHAVERGLPTTVDHFIVRAAV